MKNTPMSRGQKITLLKDLREGKRSVSELRAPKVTFLHIANDEPGIVRKKLPGNLPEEIITPEEAQRLYDSKNEGDIVWVQVLNYEDGSDWWKEERFKYLDIFYK